MKTEKYEVFRGCFDNGQLYSEYYYLDGKLHNTTGPAIKCWDDNGQLNYEYYYLDGKHHTKEQFDNRKNTCNGKEIIIEGKKYKLTLI